MNMSMTDQFTASQNHSHKVLEELKVPGDNELFRFGKSTYPMGVAERYDKELGFPAGNEHVRFDRIKLPEARIQEPE